MEFKKPYSFWTAATEIKYSPPSGWEFVKWPKTDSSFTLKTPKVKMEVESVNDLKKRGAIDLSLLSPIVKKQFQVRVHEPDKEIFEVWTYPDDLKDIVFGIAKELTTQYPFKMADVPKAKYKAPPKNSSVPDVKKIKIDFEVGTYVKVISGPYPEVMKKYVQRIDSRRPGDALITRWYSRKMKNVSSWVPLTCLVAVDEKEVPLDTCLKFGANNSGSGPDMERRGHCDYCEVKKICRWFVKSKISDKTTKNS